MAVPRENITSKHHTFGTVTGGVQIDSPGATQQVSVVGDVTQTFANLREIIRGSDLDPIAKVETEANVAQAEQLALLPPTTPGLKMKLHEKLQAVETALRLSGKGYQLSVPLIDWLKAWVEGG